MQFNDEYEYQQYEYLIQKHYDENPCFNGETHNSIPIEELIRYRASSDCEMGG